MIVEGFQATLDTGVDAYRLSISRYLAEYRTMVKFCGRW